MHSGLLQCFALAARAGGSAPRMSSGQVCALSSPLVALRKAPRSLVLCLRDHTQTRSGWAVRGARRSEVKEEPTAQPVAGDMSGGGCAASASRGARVNISKGPIWAP